MAPGESSCVSSSRTALATPRCTDTSKPASLWLRVMAAATTFKVEGFAPDSHLSFR